MPLRKSNIEQDLGQNEGFIKIIHTGCPKKKWSIAIPHITLLKMVRFSKFFFSWPRFRSEVPRGNDIFLIKLEFHQKNWLQTNLVQN